jgi:hypothetical protein
LWTAAVPIVVAWPLAGWLIVHNAALGMLTPGRVFSIAVLPLLLTFGSFLFARGRLTDRFALHAVVVGFGARDPARPGEPYRCRQCEANLPDAMSSPVVRCVYCDKPNVLGLDVSGDAEEATKERKHLDRSFEEREKERWLWRLGTLGAAALLVGSFFVVRGTLRDITRVDFAPLSYTASVVNQNVPGRSSHMPPVDDAAEGTHVQWTARVTPSTLRGVNCHVHLHAADKKETFDYDHDGRCTISNGMPVKYSDAWTSSKDNDPKVDIDLRKQTVAIHDEAENGGEWRIVLALHPVK